MRNLAIVILGLLLSGFVFAAPILSLNGHVVYAGNASAAEGANVTLMKECLFNSGAGQPSWTVLALNSTLTSSNGGYNLSFDNGSIPMCGAPPCCIPGPPVVYDFRAYRYNPSYPDRVTHTSNFMPPLPYDVLSSAVSTLNQTRMPVGLLPAVTIFINATNASGIPSNFSYFFKDAGSDFNLGNNMNGQGGSRNATFHVLADRNYSLTFFKRPSGGGPFPDAAFPKTVILTSKNLTQDASDNLLAYTADMNQSTITVTGNLVGAGGGATYTHILFYPLAAGEMFYGPNGKPLSLDRCGVIPIPFGPPCIDLNATEGNFSLSLISSAEGIDYVAFAYANKSGPTMQYGAFQNITAKTGQNQPMNLALRQLRGPQGQFFYTNYTDDINITRYKVTVFDNRTNQTVQTPGHLKLSISDSNSNGPVSFRMGVEANSSGAFLFSLVSGSNASYELFTMGKAPMKGSISPTFDFMTLQAKGMEFESPDGQQFGGIEVQFLASNSACNVPQPPPSCMLTNFTANASDQSFNPLGFTLAGVNISMRMTDHQAGVVVQVHNVDLIASGPPTASFDASTNSTRNASASLLEEARRVGSFAPRVYSDALVGMRLGATMNPSGNVSVLIRTLYDDAWGSTWNSSDNPGGSGVPAYFQDYNQSLFNSSAGGVQCNSTNPSATCFLNASAGWVWVRVPHFSGGQQAIIGEEVVACPLINESGYYRMNNSLNGAPNPAPEVSAAVCVRIGASNVTFDCSGYGITNNGTGGPTVGILVSGVTSNVTIRNCPNIANYTRGIYLFHTNLSLVTNVTVADNSVAGFMTDYSTQNNFTNSISSHNLYGFYISRGSGNRVVNGLAHDSGPSGTAFYAYGVPSDPAANNVFAHNIAFNCMEGFHLEGASDSNNYVNNSAYNTTIGLEIVGASNNDFTGSTLYDYSQAGIYLRPTTLSPVLNTRFWNTTLYSGRGGVSINPVSTTGYPIVYNMTNTTIRNATGGMATEYSVFSINDTVAPGENYIMNWSGPVGPLPLQRISFANKYLNIAALNATPSINSFIWNWQDSELSLPPGYSESLLESWVYNAGWSTAGGTRNETQNSISFTNLNPAGTFAILQGPEQCPVIRTPNTVYVMNNSLGGSPNLDAAASTWACIIIGAPNVTLDCNGNRIIQNTTTISEVGIFLNASAQNATVRNCRVENYSSGIQSSSANGSTFVNNTASSAVNGFYLSNAANNTLRNNLAYNTSNAGFMLSGRGNHNLVNNTARNNTQSGFYLTSSSNNSLLNNTAYGDNAGFYLESGAINNTLTNNTAYGNANYGFIILANQNTLRGNTAYLHASGTGFYLQSGSGNAFDANTAYGNYYSFYVSQTTGRNNFTNNLAENNSIGFFAGQSSGDTYINNSARGNRGMGGFYLQQSSGNNLTNNTACGNKEGFYLDFRSENNTLANNTAFRNNLSGFRVEDSNLNNIGFSHAFNNTWDLRIAASSNFSVNVISFAMDTPAGAYQPGNYSNVSIFDDVKSGETYMLNWTGTVASPPSGRTVVARKLFDFTIQSGSPVIDGNFYVRYSDADISGYSEERLELWKYNSSGWGRVGATLDTAFNAFNVSGYAPGSVFAIMQGPEPCARIGTPNTNYVMNTTVEGAPNYVGATEAHVGGYACMKIFASNVAFSCNGNVIQNDGTGGTTFGILLNQSATNVTVRDCPGLLNYTYGLYNYRAENSTFTNLTSVSSAGGYAIRAAGRNSTYSHNTLCNGYLSGVFVAANAYSYFINNSATACSIAFNVVGHNNTFINNTVRGGTTGFDVNTGSSDNTFINNRVTGAATYGALVLGAATNNNFTNNTMSGGNYGFYLTTVASAALVNNTVYNNTYDLYLYGSITSLNVTRMLFTNDYGTMENYSVVSLNDSLASGEKYYIDWAPNTSLSAQLPARSRSFANKYATIHQDLGTSSISNIAWHWDDSELSGYDEFHFQLWRYNSSTGWAALNTGSAASVLTNSLSLSSYTPASIYAILEVPVNCPVISTPNTNYVMNNSFWGAPNMWFSNPACIIVSAENVTLDCNGYNVANNGTNNAAGIVFNTTAINATVRNCDISGYVYGLYSLSANGSRIYNNRAHDGDYGFVISASHSTLTNNSAWNFSGNGFHLNGAGGVLANNNTLINNSANSSGIGFFLESASGNSLYGNLGYGGSDHGFLLETSSNCVLANNSAYNNAGSSGFRADAQSGNNTFANNTAYGNLYGFDLEAAFNGTYINNTARDNTVAGFNVLESGLNTFVNNTAYSNSHYGFYLDSSSRNNLTNNSIYGHNDATFGYGIYLANSSGNRMSNNTAWSNRMGILLNYKSDNNTARYNAISGGDGGVYLYGGASGNNISGNTVTNSYRGIWVYNASYNTIDANRVVGTGGTDSGILIGTDAINTNCDYNNFTGNSISGTSYLALDLMHGTGHRFRDTLIYGNTLYDFRAYPGTWVTYSMVNTTFTNRYGTPENSTSVSINDSVGANELYLINWTSAPASLPPLYGSFAQKFVYASAQGGTPSIDSITWNWDTSELSLPPTYDENLFSLWLYNSSGWANARATLDTAANTLNISNFRPGSVYAIFQGLPNCPVITAPNSNYVMNNSFIGAPNAATEAFGGSNMVACVKIAAQNVTFDCKGYNLTNDGTANASGIVINASAGNVTVKNCAGISNYRYGAFMYSSNNNTLSNSSVYDTASGVSSIGIYVWGNFTNITGNTVRNVTAPGSAIGIYLYQSRGSTLAYNRVNASGSSGSVTAIFAQLSSNNSIYWNNATNLPAGATGFNVYGGSADDNVTDNIAEGGYYGYWVESTNRLARNTARNAVSGFLVRAAPRTTVSDSTAYNCTHGFLANETSGSVLVNNTARDNGHSGFYLVDSDLNTLVNNTAYRNGIYGIYLGVYFAAGSNWNNITNNSVSEHRDATYGQGIYLATSSNNRVSANTLWNNRAGVEFNSQSDNNTFAANLARNNSFSGYVFASGYGNLAENNTAYLISNSGFLLAASYNTLRNNIAYTHGGGPYSDGFLLTGGSDNNLTNNSAWGASRYGFFINSAQGNTLTNCTAYNNGWYGLMVDGGNNTRAINFHTYNNSVRDVYAYGYPTPTVFYLTNLTLDNASGTYENFTRIDLNETITSAQWNVKWSAAPATLPTDRALFAGKASDISRVSGTVAVDSGIWRWEDTELTGYNESRFELWLYNSSTAAWQRLNNSPNTAQNTLGLSGFAADGIFAILQNNEVPRINVTAYQPANGSWFNVTTVAFTYMAASNSDTQFNCSLYIDGLNNQTNSTYQNGSAGTFTAANLAAGRHTWSVRCNDTFAYNYSDTRNLTVDLVPPAVGLLLPIPGYIGNDTSMVWFNFTVTDGLSPSMNCSTYVDGQFRANAAGMANGSWFSFTAMLSEGYHTWYTVCSDLANNTNYSATRNFTVDVTPPSVTLLFPPPNYGTNLSAVNFTFVAADSVSQALNCSLMLNGAPVATNDSVLNNTMSNISRLMGSGVYNWTVMCRDIANNSGSATAQQVTVDLTPPSITLNAPRANYYGNDTRLDFNFTATDDLSAVLMTCSALIDGAAAGTNGSVLNNTPTVMSLAVPGGSHTWAVSCYDGFNTNTSASRAYYLDQTPPTIALNAPADGYATGTNEPANVTFNFTASDDNSSTLNCTFYLDAIANYTNGSIANGSSTAFNRSLEVGTHTWHVWCRDYANNTATSGTNTFYVGSAPAAPPPSSGGGTASKRFVLSASRDCPGDTLVVYAKETTGQPVAGASVRAILDSPYQGLVAQGTTDSAGKVSFPLSAYGAYVFNAYMAGYQNPAPLGWDFAACAGQQPVQPPANVTPPVLPQNITPPANVTPPSAPNATAMLQAQQAIADAQSEIAKAQGQNKDVASAMAKLAEAQAAFAGGRYADAFLKAGEAVALAQAAVTKPPAPQVPSVPSAPPATPPAQPKGGIDWLPILAVAAVVLVVIAGVAGYMLLGKGGGPGGRGGGSPPYQQRSAAVRGGFAVSGRSST